jgi:uncharacterized protein (DUF1800 family)
MTQSLATISAVRFGYGLGQGYGPVSALGELMDQLSGPDTIVQDYPTLKIQEAKRLHIEKVAVNKLARKGDQNATELFKSYQKKLIQSVAMSKRNIIARSAFSENGFRERLVQFWTDHFTVASKNLSLGSTIPSFIDDAIRPNISSTFSDLLTACTLHPAMLNYLDQISSFGPNSQIGKRRGLGLNENLARELLELHTLGVVGDYTQQDVRQLAELLTGLRTPKGETVFQSKIAEPGAKQVLGNSYGGDKASLGDIKQFLQDVAQRPDTAINIARKLVTHFVSDTPDDAHVNFVAKRFYDSKGDLKQTYTALLEHPQSRTDLGNKVKQPFDYVVSGIRALNYDPAFMLGLNLAQYRRNFDVPMRLMGQNMFVASGPDGWPEEAEAWITPTGLSGRLQWAMQATRDKVNQFDPREFLHTALGELASDELAWAVPKAASKHEALAMVLASPEFNRR